ncbi:ubiquinol-cytochrome c reductase iron-sulfur subunit [Noviherbaspirillum cavernae]|uniref:Ubiquinol-cytochrome c reductase iron-sulfur subunit n=1 Tax=Noviherbaspirillum cavernae TaxID=2320862 RepID=A0A418X211_9BURK|nr:ubiquinol-cytochrome c reductase iron-sulfur subunit [Noviherbaspirillum cavernae]RJG06489.1 ubiquinol-cytochrome c reductase iron-sulfur subunit [Noviherbaspirillum cavernae]
MATIEANEPRRKFLLTATTGLGGIGLAAVAVPFLKSMGPSEAARAAGAPVQMDIDRIAPGRLVTMEWRGKPIWILHRTDEMLASLGKHDDLLADPSSSQPQQPDYARNAARSIKPEFLVLTGICTHLGCIPVFRPDAGAADMGDDWPGGFYCPCHGSKFDLAGRVYKNVPAPLNLEVPVHRYLADGSLFVGEDEKKG